MMVYVVQAAALILGLFALMSGVALFIVGLLPMRSAPWWVQYLYAAVFLTIAYFALTYALT